VAGSLESEPNKLAEIRTAEESLRTGEPHLFRKPFGAEWGVDPWIKWATITDAFARLGVKPGSSVLDLGCGEGWTSIFLAQSGCVVTGVDLAPARIEMGKERAARWDLDVTFEIGDMDSLELRRTFDAVLVYDALHHTNRQREVITHVAQHLEPGGWVLIGEPSWLHGISPHARETTRELGWIERGITVRSLRRDCRAASLGGFRRFFEPTRPYEGRGTGFAWQAIRLVAANVAVAPQVSVWLAAQRAA
jgi:SAM-dependent methyltransferase